MNGEWANFLEQCIDLSPYLVVLICLVWAFCQITKVSLEKQAQLVDKTITQLNSNMEVVLKALQSVKNK